MSTKLPIPQRSRQARLGARRERDGLQLLIESTADALQPGRVRAGEVRGYNRQTV